MLRRSAVAACALVLALGAWAVARPHEEPPRDATADGAAQPASAAAAPGTRDGLAGWTGSMVASGTSGTGGRASEVAPVTVVPESAGPGSGPGAGAERLPRVPRPPTAPLITTIPAQLASSSGLLPGLPAVVAPLRGSHVVSSSISPGRGLAQVALTARTPASADRVLAHYRAVLGRVGMSEAASPAVGGSSAVRFARGRDVLVLTVRPTDGGTDYSVLGTLHPGRG